MGAEYPKSHDTWTATNLLASVARSANLAEGPEGVRQVLRTVFQGRAVPVREVSKQIGLPLPVVSAVRRELEKLGILSRGKGIELTELGLKMVTDELGISCHRRFPRPDYPHLPSDFDNILRQISKFCSDRPNIDRSLDQSHATSQTALRRAIYLYQNDGLEGRDIVILGDDDLTSLAISLLSKSLLLRTGKLMVLETDKRLVKYISETAKNHCLDVEVISHDLRLPIPTELKGQFDVFFTDPPYTLMGLNLFVSRGIEALRPEIGKQGYISFGRRTPDDAATSIGALTDMGFAPLEIVPDFNLYEGSQMLGGVSQMIRVVSGRPLNPRIQGPYLDHLYTGSH